MKPALEVLRSSFNGQLKHLRFEPGFVMKAPAFPFADRCLLPAHDARTGRAIPLPVVGDGEGLPAHGTPLHPGW